MCGITGALALQPNTPWNRERLAAQVGAMTSAIAHRGPDDQGLWIEPSGRLAFGHRRLSIVDLSARGRQPMHYGERFVITFNGEIYNFRELRGELSALGHQFVSATDTEVVMAAIRAWGIERALQRLLGMFAFGLWDSEHSVLYLARDRLGEKPLYLAIHEGYLIFGSELHAMEAVSGLRGRLSSRAVGLYLRHGYVPSPLSMYEGIYKLPQASFLRIPAQTSSGIAFDSQTGDIKFTGAGSLQRYWRVNPLGTQPRKEHPEAIVEQLHSLLRDAVQGQMQCDVPMGVFLSGGIDSTAVAGVTQSLSASPIATFTVKFDVPGFDESRHAAAVARHLQTDHHEISIDPAELIRSIPAQAASLDEPTANASYFPLRLMSKAARRHVKVVLSGDAGDELFGGYNRYKLTLPLWRRFAWLPAPARRLLARGAGAIPSAALTGLRGQSSQADAAASVKKLSRFLDAASLGEAYQRLMRCWDDASVIAHVTDPVEAALACDNSTFLAAVTAFDLQHYLPDDNLAKSDRATMAAGLEQRVPLLDHRIVEFARSLPDSVLINNGVTKWLLRQVAYRHVPREILDRPKMGFTVPVSDWLKGPLREWAGDLLHSDTLLEHGLLKKSAVQGYWQQLQRSQAPVAWEMWSLAIYMAWVSTRVSVGHSDQVRRLA